eukprot:scaffold587_cov339-Pavlova_lutheri.AAC.66
MRYERIAGPFFPLGLVRPPSRRPPLRSPGVLPTSSLLGFAPAPLQAALVAHAHATHLVSAHEGMDATSKSFVVDCESV